MDYKEKYEEALERAKKWYFAPNSNKIPTFANRVIKEIFPELKESEDERIRKHLIGCLKFSLKGAEDQDDAGCSRQKDIEAYKWGLAWLERQGEMEEQL